jgi:uncharacterized protein
MENQKPTLLMIDDEIEQYYTQYEYFIEDLFQKIELAQSGAEGLQKIIEDKPDFILLDYSMGGMNGIEVLKAIRAQPEISSSNVIMLSQISHDAEIIGQALDLGAIDYIAKDDRGAVVKARLSNIIRNHYQQIGTNRVFISYSRKDLDFAIRVRDTIENAGLSTFFDIDKIPASTNWRKVIQKGIETCTAMIVIFSPDSISSSNVENEYLYFLDLQQRRKKIFPNWKVNLFPVLHRECDIPFYLTPYQHISCIDDSNACIDKLGDEVVEVLTPANSNIQSIIDTYFRLVDERNFDKLRDIFHRDIVYQRPGYTPIEGIDKLIEFYRNTRVIASGEHHIEGRLIQSNQCVCWGRFIGSKRDGSTVDERFADVYTFAENLITKRTTYFYKEAV